MLRPPHYLAFAVTLAMTPALLGLVSPGASLPEAPSAVRRDRQGDPLPAGARARLGTTRLRHPSPPTAAAFSPDGRTLATASAYYGSGGVWLWDPATGELRRRITSSLPSAMSFQFTPDGKAIVRNVGGWFGLWDVRTGQEVRKLALPEPREILEFALSSDGTLLATYHYERAVRIWDIASGKQVGRLLREGAWDPEVVWVPRTRTLAVFAHDPKRGPLLRFWDADSGITRRFAPIPPLAKSQGSECVAFAPDGKTMVAVGGDTELRVFDVGTFKERLPSKGRVPPPRDLIFSPDGRTLALSCQDGMVWLLDFHGGKESRKLPPSVARQALAFSPDSKTLAATGRGNEIRLWEVATGKERLPCPGSYQASMPVAFSADGRKLLALGEGLRFWDIPTAAEWRPALRQIQYPADVVAHGDKLLVVGRRDQRIELWDVAGRKQLVSFAPERDKDFPANTTVAGPLSLALSADGSTLAVSNLYDTVTLYDTRARKRLWSFSAEVKQFAQPLALSPDGRTLAIRGRKGQVAVWDVPTRKSRFRFRHSQYVGALAYSPDGKTLATVNNEGTVRLWDAATGKARRDLPGRLPFAERLAFSPDSARLAVVGRSGFVLWEVATGKRRELVRESSGYVCGVVFAPDGSRVATGSLDGTMLVWDIAPKRGGRDATSEGSR